MRLEGKTLLVTGAGAGIGAACARTYAREGATVFAVDLDADKLRGVVDGIVQAGGKAHAHAANLGDTAAIDTMMAAALERLGHLDILHNNTAFVPRGPLGDIGLDDWRRAFDVGLTSYWYASKLALAHMTARGGGVILNTASISGLAADHGMGGYNVMKAGVVNLTRSIAIDYARKGIRCNAICPGIVFTEAFQALKDRFPERYDAMAGAVPMGRFGTPQEVANLALFLASDEAPYLTGEAVVIDGGRLAFTGTPSPVGYQPY